MIEFTVTMRLRDREAFMHFIETVGPATDQLMVTVTQTETPMFATAGPDFRPNQAEARPQRKHGPRGSKVNDTVLSLLMQGQKTVKELKTALEDVGLKAGSLSTSLALLQRANQIYRVSDGVYALGPAFAKAAE